MKLQKIIPYIGYGTPHEVHLMGSLVNETKRTESLENDSKWVNAKRMIQNFYSKPIKYTNVSIIVNELAFNVQTDKKGYFEVKCHFEKELSVGWHTAQYSFKNNKGENIIKSESFLIVDEKSTSGVISDIDDTIVESYSYLFFRKLWIMLTSNETTRKITKNISGFYKRLYSEFNPFFYVSSSEKNLYPYWMLLMKRRGFPPGPLLLNEFRYGFRQLMFSGNGNHQHKYDKIAHLLNFYKNMLFILVGDNGQKDVQIYYQLVRDFPNRIKSVYIVQVRKRKIKKEIIKMIETHNIDLIITKNLDEAIEHAIQKGFINPDE